MLIANVLLNYLHNVKQIAYGAITNMKRCAVFLHNC